jgi:transcriptional regulator with XRE-family HTH domain
MTQMKLAKRLGVCAQYVSSIENGHKPFLSAPRVNRVAAILDLTAQELRELESRRFDGARRLMVTGRCSTKQFEFAALVASVAHRVSESHLRDLTALIRRAIDSPPD